jgi:hypothetical protein
MAKASFHKNQRVYVKPVGTWALIERVVPHWAKGLDEPLRVFYDVGLGREFAAEELQFDNAQTEEARGDKWRIMRAHNRWQSPAESVNHPFPGTYPVVVTGEADWGGWRVPGAEYALSPARIELQARLVAGAPQMAAILKELTDWAKTCAGDVPQAMMGALKKAKDVLAYAEDASEP